MSDNMAIVIAMFQGAAHLGEVQKNLVIMKEQVFKAKNAGAQIIVFPELFLTGYCLKAEDMKTVAQESNGQAFQELSTLAKETGVAILYGYPEAVPSGEQIYNSAQLIDKDGKSLVNHRKIHLWIDENGYERVFTKADRFSDVVEYCGLKIGLLICYDVEFPEAVLTLAVRGANVVLVPTAVAGSPENVLSKITNIIVPARAYENNIHVVYVNNTGSIFEGKSVCCNPLGDVIASGGADEELLFASIDISVTNTDNILNNRRPSLYDK